MGRLLPLYVLLDIALICVALIDCLSSDDSDIRALPKVVWVFIILLFSPIGPIVWFVAGRPQRVATGGGGWTPGVGPQEPNRPIRARARRPLAPDDDPEFLKKIGEPNSDEELFRRWEEDLKRREDDLRRKEGDEPPSEK